MKKMKYLRTWLVAALLVTIIGSLTGGTIAWFTDSVESTGNIIESGTLDIKLSAKEKSSDEWAEVTDESAPLFDYSLWEPGYTEVRYLKIANAGNLALKYQFGINPSSITTVGQSNLAEVIDMYVFDADAIINRDTIASANPVGTLEDLKAEGAKAFEGYLLPAEGVGSEDFNEEVTAPRGAVEKVIVLKMQETAGNEYQNCSLSNIGIKLEAAQYMWENDSFDHKYDEEAEYDNGLPKANITVDNTNPRFSLYDLASFSSLGMDLQADVAYVFKATETAEEAAAGPYGDWHADYVITVNKEIKAESAGLVGGYGSYGTLGFLIPQDAVPGVEYRLLKDVSGRGIQFSYESICADVGEFMCGVFNLDEANVGTTLTVELRLYELAGDTMNNENNEGETGNYVVAARTVYALEAPQQFNLDEMNK